MHSVCGLPGYRLKQLHTGRNSVAALKGTGCMGSCYLELELSGCRLMR